MCATRSLADFFPVGGGGDAPLKAKDVDDKGKGSPEVYSRQPRYRCLLLGACSMNSPRPAIWLVPNKHVMISRRLKYAPINV